MEEYVSLLGYTEQRYVLQIREAIKSGFEKGKLPFVFPGVLGLFGGAVEGMETPEEAFRREIMEELPALKLPSNSLEIKTYDWKVQADEIFGRINEAFQGNATNFLGFAFDSLIPNSALGEYRGQNITYRDFLNYVGHYFPIKIKDYGILRDEEGAGVVVADVNIAKSLVMEPGDKLALLDDIVDRAEQGLIKLI